MDVEIKKKNIFVSFFRGIYLWIDSDATVNLDMTSDKVNWIRTIPFMILHIACFGVFFVGWSWFAVLFAIGFYFIRMFTITGFYHRYFSHKTFKTNRFWQFIFALIGSSCVQRGALWWAAHHRSHHRYSDSEEDLHSPWQRGFWWSHMGWITCDRSFRTDYSSIKDYAKYPELVFLNRFDTLVPILITVSIFYLGVFLEAFFPGLNTNGPQMLVWGFFISTTVLFHCTVFINSLCHVWGRKRFNTDDQSRNNFWLALITLGEGWHNNHHRYPATVRQGFYWWEVDITYYILKTMSWIGIIRELKPLPRAVYNEGLEIDRVRKVSLIYGERFDFNDARIFNKKSREEFKDRIKSLVKTRKE